MSYFASSTRRRGRGGEGIKSRRVWIYSIGRLVVFLSRVKKLFFWSPRLRTFIPAILPAASFVACLSSLFSHPVRACMRVFVGPPL